MIMFSLSTIGVLFAKMKPVSKLKYVGFSPQLNWLSLLQ